MWPGWIKELRDYLAAAVANDGSIKATLVGGAVGGQTIAQGDKQSDGTKAWPVRLFNASGALLGRLAASASIPVVLATEDAAALGAIAPAASLVLLDLSSTDITSLPTFRSIRFDGAGTFKVDIAGGATGVTLNVLAGSTEPWASSCFSKLYRSGTSATGIYGLV